MTILRQTRIILLIGFLSLSPFVFSADQLSSNQQTPSYQQTQENTIESAMLQEGNGEFDQAIDLYEQLIAQIQSNHGTFSDHLIEPLQGLARSYFALKEFESAIQALAQAQHLVHRYHGVYSLRQEEGIDLLIKAYLKMDEVGLANKQQSFKLFLSEHNVGKESIELLPALERINRWYIETGQFNRAKRALQRSQTIIISEDGEFDPKQLDILSNLSKVRRLSRFCCSYKILEEGLSILNANPNLAKSKQASYYLELADAYTMSRKHEEAQQTYAKAWDLTKPYDRHIFIEPKGINFAKEINNGRSTNSKIYLVDRDRLGPRRFEEVSHQEKLILETLSPQDFQFSTTPGAPNYRIRDLNAGASIRAKKEIQTIGYPFIFNREQLKQILPFRLQKDTALKALKIEMEFNVTSKGHTEQVKIITSGLPTKLSRLMRDVLNQSLFRPTLVKGEPVMSKGVRLIQTFE